MCLAHGGLGNDDVRLFEAPRMTTGAIMQFDTKIAVVVRTDLERHGRS